MSQGYQPKAGGAQARPPRSGSSASTPFARRKAALIEGLRQHAAETDDLRKAQDIAKKIQDRAKEALEPLAREMRLMGWKPEFQSIQWAAVANEANRRAMGEQS